MAVLPHSDIEMIEWFEQRLADWAADPEAIGLTGGQIITLTGQVAAGRSSYNTAQQARNTSRSATVVFHDDSGTLRNFGGDLIKTIKAFAETTDDQSVYADADVPPPAPPSPRGAPGMPTNITTALTNLGAIELAWKADNASASTGAFFVIQRKLDGETRWTNIGQTGAKSFSDATVPLGTTRATYIIIPWRGDLVGPASTQLSVQFGVEDPPQTQSEGNTEGMGIAA